MRGCQLNEEGTQCRAFEAHGQRIDNGMASIRAVLGGNEQDQRFENGDSQGVFAGMRHLKPTERGYRQSSDEPYARMKRLRPCSA